MCLKKKSADLVKNVAAYLSKAKGFDHFLGKMKVCEAPPGKCIMEFTVEDEHCNAAGSLHGGLTATLVDCVTTMALLTKGDHPGVSVNLSVNYLRPVFKGEDVIIDATAVKVGKMLAYLQCELRNKKNDAIIAKGEQTKYIAQ